MAVAKRHKRRFSLLIVFTVLLVILLAVWTVIAGPVTVLRILRYGDTNIDDFSHYPGRELVASETRFAFDERQRELQLPAAALSRFGNAPDLETLVAANDSIAILVIHDDVIVFERYFQGHSEAELSQVFSVSKSLFSLLVGAALEDGYFEGLDQPITDLLPELAEAGFGEVRIRHLLTMTSGSDYVENDNPFGEHVILNYTPQLEREILRFAMDDIPGSTFRYKSGDNALLALALDRALGDETLTAYLQRRFWTPMGMAHRGVWSTDRDGGLEKTWCCLAMTARDLARFGRLLLRRGEWNGERLLSADWVADSTQWNQLPESAFPPEYRAIGWRNYGFQWWLGSQLDREFFALGKDGQFLYVNPRRDVIVVRLGWSSGDLTSGDWVELFRELAASFGTRGGAAIVGPDKDSPVPERVLVKRRIVGEEIRQ